jgi:hypothetical protein
LAQFLKGGKFHCLVITAILGAEAGQGAMEKSVALRSKVRI